MPCFCPVRYYGLSRNLKKNFADCARMNAIYLNVRAREDILNCGFGMLLGMGGMRSR
jgi:hypothetical protein